MRSSSYLSTSQTARMLGLSVGTVQRMVESGVLQAYTTQGGHRRILAASIRSYCQKHGVPASPLLPSGKGICIIHRASLPPALNQALQAMPQVRLISHPLELAGIAEDCPALFVDAQVSWLDWPDLHRPQSVLPAARLVVYNSAQLSTELQASLSSQALLHPSDISTDLIEGFLLGIGALEAVTEAIPEMH